MAVRSGHQWSWLVKEKFLGLFEWSFEIERREILFFTLKNIYNLEISLSKMVLLSRNPLLALSMTFRVEHNSSQVGIWAERNSTRVGNALNVLVSLSKMSKSVILKIPIVKAWRHGLLTYCLNLKVIQQLTSPGSWFYRNRFG